MPPPVGTAPAPPASPEPLAAYFADRAQTVGLSAIRQAAAAIRQGAPDGAPVFGLSASQIGRRIKAAADAAGLGAGYSGRVGLAVRMTANGAPTHAVMLAGRWQSAGMVARYTRSLTAADAARYL